MKKLGVYLSIMLIALVAGVMLYPAKGKAVIENPPSVVSLSGVSEDAFYIEGNVIKIVGHPTPEERKLFEEERERSNKQYRKDVAGEIYRKWKAGIEVDKYKNAWMLKNAAASTTVVNALHTTRVDVFKPVVTEPTSEK